MADKLIKNPDTESAYQYIPAQVPDEQQDGNAETTYTKEQVDKMFADNGGGATPTTGQEQVTTTPVAGAPAGNAAGTTGQNGNLNNAGGEAGAENGTGANNPPATVSVDGQQQPAAEAAGTATNTPVAGAPAVGAAGTTGQQQPAADTTGTVAVDPNSSEAIQNEQMAKMNEVTDPVTGTPVAQPVEQAPAYLTEWSSNSNPYEVAKQLNLPIAQVLRDYQKWGNDTGNPTNWLDYELMEQDLSKTPDELEKEKKRQERKERWDKVGNFLLHLGNVIGNQVGGGYGSVKLEDPVQWSERQRLLKEKTLEQRRRLNDSYFTKMYKERAAQREYEMNRQRLENDKRKLDRLDEDQRLKNRKQDWLEKYQQGVLDDKAERRRIEEEYKNKKISLDERNTAVRELNAMTNSFKAHSPSTTTSTMTKADGSTQTRTSTTQRGSAGQTSGRRQSGGGKKESKERRKSKTQL